MKFGKISKAMLAMIAGVCLLISGGILPTAAFTGSIAAMPETFTLIEDFEDGTTGWTAVGNGRLSVSTDRGYGTDGQSLHVSWTDTSSWHGAKTEGNEGTFRAANDGLALWLYVVNPVPSNRNFNVNFSQGSNKFEYKVPAEELTAGEHVITIPWTSFTPKAGAFDSSAYITQIELTSNYAEGEYYLDQVGTYAGEATQSPFVPSTLEMPGNMVLFEDFENGENSQGTWTVGGNAAVARSQDRGYGASGSSLHVTWSQSGWSGAKSENNRSIAITGDGLAFWIYTESAVNGFVAKLRQGSATTEKSVNLTAGENVVQIPWSDFDGLDMDSPITQIEFTYSAASGNYYVDQIGSYSSFIPSTRSLPDSFRLLSGLDFEGDISIWESSNKAAIEKSKDRGYGTDGYSLHVAWSESGWSGAKIKTGEISLSLADARDGLTMWVYSGSAVSSFYVKVRQGNISYEKSVSLAAGENILQIPWSEFLASGAGLDMTGTISQIEFTHSAASADYYVDQIGTYELPKKPEVSEVVLSQSWKSSSSLVGGNGQGNSGGRDPVLWKIYGITGDERFDTAVHFTADDITAGRFFLYQNVDGAGPAEITDITSAVDFGYMRFWIKNSVADRKLKVSVMDSHGHAAGYIEFTITEAEEWQEIRIPVSSFLENSPILSNCPDYLTTINRVVFDGSGVGEEYTYRYGETFKIAGLKIYTADPVDYSELDGTDTEPTQPADDGSYATGGVLGSVDMEIDPYSGNSGIGTVVKESINDLGYVTEAFKWTVGAGVNDDSQTTKGLSFYFGEDGTGSTVDVTSAQDGYFSFWVRGSRAGTTFTYLLLDDTSNDAKSSIVKRYTIQEADTWEEVRVPFTEFLLPDALDREYIASFVVRTVYGVFNWRYAYTDADYLMEGDVLEFANMALTSGKPVDPFAEPVDEGDEDGGDTPGTSDTSGPSGTTGTGASDSTGTTGASGGATTGAADDDSSEDDAPADTGSTLPPAVPALLLASAAVVFLLYRRRKIAQ